jgi:hypothetical protein
MHDMKWVSTVIIQYDYSSQVAAKDDDDDEGVVGVVCDLTVVQHSLIIHACAPDHTPRTRTAAGENWKPNVSTMFYTTAHLDCFPPNVGRAQSCLTPRDLATICPSLFCNSPHGDGRQDRRLRYTHISSPGIARHGMASRMGRSGDARGDFCLCFTVHCCSHGQGRWSLLLR